jgi:hypothetical protein
VRNYGKILFALLVTVSVAGLILGLSPGDAKDDGRQENGPTVAQPQHVPRPAAAAPVKTSTSQETVGLPGKSISLAEAVVIAEKLGKGQALKAERKDKPEIAFRIEVVGEDGQRSKIELTGDGQPKEKK